MEQVTSVDTTLAFPPELAPTVVINTSSPKKNLILDYVGYATLGFGKATHRHGVQ